MWTTRPSSHSVHETGMAWKENKTARHRTCFEGAPFSPRGPWRLTGRIVLRPKTSTWMQESEVEPLLSRPSAVLAQPNHYTICRARGLLDPGRWIPQRPLLFKQRKVNHKRVTQLMRIPCIPSLQRCPPPTCSTSCRSPECSKGGRTCQAKSLPSRCPGPWTALFRYFPFALG